MYVARRLVRMATEDIGLANPSALAVAVACRDAYRFLGTPEGELALAQATVYLAGSPKSNRLYKGWGRALARARETPGEAVPLHLRNAPTKLMKDPWPRRGVSLRSGSAGWRIPAALPAGRTGRRAVLQPRRQGAGRPTWGGGSPSGGERGGSDRFRRNCWTCAPRSTARFWSAHRVTRRERTTPGNTSRNWRG